MSSIYSLNCPITGEVKYIGKSCNPKNRFKTHLSLAKHNKNTSKKTVWISEVLKLGLKPVLVIEDLVENDNWEFWEEYYISLYRSWGFDLTNQSHGGIKNHLTIEARIKSHNGYREFLSKKKEKRKMPPRTEDRIRRQSESLKKYYQTHDSTKWRPVDQYTFDGNFIESFKSIKCAAKKTGLLESKIAAASRGCRKSHGGFIWKRKFGL